MPWQSLVENLESIRIAGQILFAMDMAARKKRVRAQELGRGGGARCGLLTAAERERAEAAPNVSVGWMAGRCAQ